MSLKLGSGFRVADEAGRMSEETLRKAKNLHDILFRTSTPPRGQSSRPASSLHDKRKKENDNQLDTKKRKLDKVQCFECR
eukprot:1046035-Karenia_brevis.AAC.1